MARFGILSKPQRTAAAKCGQQAPFVSSAAVRSNLASAVVDAPSAARALGEAKFHAWSRPGLAGDICCKDSKTDRRATDWRIDMRKVPSMIQHGNRPYESAHLGNGNTLASPDRCVSGTSVCNLPGRIAPSSFRCGATTLDDRAGMILGPPQCGT